VSLTSEKTETRAYDLYLERNGNGESQLEDWLKAEKEVKKGNGERSEKSILQKSKHKVQQEFGIKTR
jgi:hypothetical protein